MWKKRKLDNSGNDDDYESPAKKSINPQVLSPDLGCFMDYCSPPARQDSLSPFANSTLLDKKHEIRSEIKEGVNSQLYSDHRECGSSTGPGGKNGTMPKSLMCEKVALNMASTLTTSCVSILVALILQDDFLKM